MFMDRKFRAGSMRALFALFVEIKTRISGEKDIHSRLTHGSKPHVIITTEFDVRWHVHECNSAFPR